MLAVPASERRLVVGVYLFAVCAVALVALVGAIARARPRAPLHGRPGRPSVRDAAPGELEALRRRIVIATASEAEYHYRLRPVLAEVAAALLGGRRGLDLERDPERARAAFGPETWELIRPDRSPPGDRLARGPSAAELERLLSALEGL